MVRNPILLVEDDETKQISGALGHKEECEAFIEHEVQYHRSRGRTVVDVEAGEVRAKCEGEGRIPAGNDGRVICHTCGGHQGQVTPFVHFL